MNIGIGVDVGGTHITAACIDFSKKQILEDTICTTLINNQANALELLSKFNEAIVQSYNLLPSHNNKLSCVGLAFPGPFDYVKGVSKIQGVKKFDNIFGLSIKPYFSASFPDFNVNKISFLNDADCFLCGEYWLKDLSKYKNIVGITLGTGFGSSYIKKENYDDVFTKSLHTGFFYLTPYGDSIADEYIPIRWILKRWKELTGLTATGVKEIAEIADNNDKAKELFNEFGSNLSNILIPKLERLKAEKLIIGGNIAKANKHYLHFLKDAIKEKGLNTDIVISHDSDKSALCGAAYWASECLKNEPKQIRNTSQFLMPSIKKEVQQNDYDIYPAYEIGENKIFKGLDSLADRLAKEKTVIIDGFIGVQWEALCEKLERIFRKKNIKACWWNIEAGYVEKEQYDAAIKPYLGEDDPLFGRLIDKELKDFIEPDYIKKLLPDNNADINIIYGCGAALSGWIGLNVYLDIPKNEIQYRAKAGSVTNLYEEYPGNPQAMYKQFYFVDWVLLNKHKAMLLPEIDIIADAQRTNEITWMTGADFRNSLNDMSEHSFRVKPWFEPGAWGGNWIRNNIKNISTDVPNYAWSFELITPENGIIFSSNLVIERSRNNVQSRNNVLLETSFDFLMYSNYNNILGKAADQFKFNFPIRFDFLDTFNGGNLSLQCHPTQKYISKNFNEPFTQDESYYILDCKPGAKVYLGFQDDIDKNKFRKVLTDSIEKNITVDVDSYIQSHPAAKHDYFLIPNGTVHCSGTDNLVLEISSTPYIYTFKMYDWLRPDLDGNARTLNIDKAFDVIDFSRKGQKVKDEHISKPSLIDKGKDWNLFSLSSHPLQFYAVKRLVFNSEFEMNTDNTCYILSLVEGESIDVITGDRKQTIHYAETFIIPAASGKFKFISRASSESTVIMAYIKDNFSIV